MCVPRPGCFATDEKLWPLQPDMLRVIDLHSLQSNDETFSVECAGQYEWHSVNSIDEPYQYM